MVPNDSISPSYLSYSHPSPISHPYSKLYFLASYICERTLQETDILHFLPSMVAAAAVYLARKNCGLRPWVCLCARVLAASFRLASLSPSRQHASI